MMGQSILLLLGFSLLATQVRCEVFSSMATLAKALENEKALATVLRDYIDKEKARLDQVMKLADHYESHATGALVDPERHISNPINAYLFVKMFTSEFPQTKELLSAEKSSQEFFERYEGMKAGLPDAEDLHGVVSAVIRLQDTYQLDAASIANGTFTPTNRSPPMSAGDCFQFGLTAHENKDYYHTILWMLEALEKLKNEAEPTVSEAVVYDYLSFAMYNQGNMRHARYYTSQWLNIEPTHERARKNYKFYSNEIQKENEELRQRREPAIPDDRLPPLKNMRQLDWYRNSQEFKDYEALCRGEDLVPNPYEHRVKCYYVTNNHPALLLAPVKVEEFYLDPLVVMYHDIMSDNEINVLKELSIPKLRRATVNDPATGKLVTAHYRISKSAWLPDDMNATVATLSKRINAATNLTLDTVELLQTQNYGIGGQYEPHFDWAKVQNYGLGGQYEPHFDHSRSHGAEKNAFDPSQGNRIATWIGYFTDVDAGGYTVFTSLGAKIPPKKGSAAFWYNLLKNGEGDVRTRHAGCPVLAGSKWVANKWFHIRGQEFSRPCSLIESE